MKTYLVLGCAAALLTLSAATTPPPTPVVAASRALTPDEQLFTKLIEQVSTAIEKHDMTALGQYMAPEYVHYNPDNGSGNRAEELAFITKWSNMSVKLHGPVKVNRYGDTAITVATSTFSGMVQGEEFNSTTQMMIAWVLRDGKWQMAVIQSKPVPAQGVKN